jgi:hypothetical protein
MRIEQETRWPCGFLFRASWSASWRTRPRLTADGCPLHGRHCPVPMDAPLRNKLRELRREMYELDIDPLWERLEEIIFEAIGPGQLPEKQEESG